MRNSRYRYTRLVMVFDAILLGLLALALMAWPLDVAHSMGLGDFADLEWFSRFIGLALFSFAAHMATTSRAAHDTAFRRMALMMIVVSASLASMLYVGPGTLTNGRWAAIGFGAVWAVLYAITLPIKTVGLTEESASA